jgi:hypothetical protein
MVQRRSHVTTLRPRHHLHIATSISTTTPSPPLRPLRHRALAAAAISTTITTAALAAAAVPATLATAAFSTATLTAALAAATLAAACPSRRRPLHRTSTAPLRAPTVHSGKLTARKALGSFSSAPTSASGRAQRLSQRRTRASSLLR